MIIGTRLEEDRSNKIPDAITPMGNPNEIAKTIPITAKVKVVQVAFEAIHKKSGERSGGNSDNQSFRKEELPPVWIIGPDQLTLHRLQANTPRSNNNNPRCLVITTDWNFNNKLLQLMAYIVQLMKMMFIYFRSRQIEN
jgi:hypothetical protein